MDAGRLVHRGVRVGTWSMCLVLLAATAAAQPCPVLRVGNPAGNYFIPGVQGDIAYSGDLAFDAYVQPGPARPPSVIVIHGGGWTSGSRIAHVGQILETLTRGGFNWFSLDYRLSGLERYEDSVADIRSAISFIRCHAADFGIDPNGLVLLGEDSGAHLTALLSGERLPGVVGVVLIGGFYDLNAVAPLPSGIRADFLRRASPIANVVHGAPPTLVIHGAADTEARPEQARRYCAGVTQSGDHCHLIEIEGASHRSENWWPTQWRYKAAMNEWLGKLGASPSREHGPSAGVIQKDIVYTASAKLSLDAYVPSSPTAAAAVVVVHGGGWEAGDKATYITPILEPLARAGLAWFSIDYRLTPAFTHDDQLQDLRDAIRFVRAEHRRFNIDPSRIFLLGESASGQMVAQLATEDRSLAGVVSFYGVYDFNAMVTDASPRSLLVRLFRRHELNAESRAELQKYSPLYSAHADMPPMLLVNGTGERLWQQAQAFDRRLTQLGVRHDVVAIDGAPHGMENWEGHPQWMFYKQRVVEWIEQTLRGHDSPH